MKSPGDYGDLAETLVPVAMRMVGAVHDDGLPEVARVMSTVAACELHALVVVLAAMVDPERTAAELLHWVTWEDVAPTPAATLFGMLPEPVPSVDPGDWSDARCVRLHSAWRARRRGNPRAWGESSYSERLGYLEHEKRRKGRARASAGALRAAATP